MISYVNMSKLMIFFFGSRDNTISRVPLLIKNKPDLELMAAKNNPDKFPKGYIIALDQTDWVGLKSNILTAILKSQFATSFLK